MILDGKNLDSSHRCEVRVVVRAGGHDFNRTIEKADIDSCTVVLGGGVGVCWNWKACGVGGIGSPQLRVENALGPGGRLCCGCSDHGYHYKSEQDMPAPHCKLHDFRKTSTGMLQTYSPGGIVRQATGGWAHCSLL